jgi:ATP-binding cassette subfamily B (MDR/TAP) protein 1
MLIVTYGYMVTWIRTSEVVAKRIRERYLQAILRQDVAFFDNIGAGEVATRIQTDTHLVQMGICEKVPMVVMFLSSFVTGFVLAFIRSWKLALACSSIFPFIVITGGVMNYFMSKYKVDQLQFMAESGTLAEEVISTIRIAQSFGTQKTLSKMYDVFVDKAHIVENKAAIFNGGAVAAFFFVIYSGYGLAFSFGTTLLLRGEVDVGVIVNVFFSILIGSFSLAMLAPEAAHISSACGAAAKLFNTIDRVPPIDSASPDGLKPDMSTITGQVAFYDVKFNYPSRPDVPVLKGVDLTFPAGKTAALVGASGSGKSTIVALIERFYDPLSGVVKLDGIDIKDLNLKWLRSNIGLVSQEPTLFATTIRKNVEHGMIGTGMENLSDEERMAKVKEACIKANADGFVSALPDGYDTMVGERGFLLSGGQKQRIAIARAIVSDPKVLLLDEATSALDTQSEVVVQNALDKASKGRTTITIAHRLSTIKDAETIYVMGDGMVLEQGTHNELLAREGSYARLVQAQRLREQQQREIDTTEGNTPSGLETPAGHQTGTGADPTDLSAKLREEQKEKIRKEKEALDIEKAAAEEKPLGRTDTSRSIASEILKQRAAEKGDSKEQHYSMSYIMKRMFSINNQSWPLYLVGFIAAIAAGVVYPAFGIVFGKYLHLYYSIMLTGTGNTMEAFQSTGHELRVKGDRAALWFFLIAIVAAISINVQITMFMRTASDLAWHLRQLSFRAILRQDIAYFDEERHSTGSLTSSLSQNPEKISGLAGATLGTIVQSIATILAGCIIGLAYGWKLALVGMACIPLVICAGYIQLRVVVLKDENNKRAHEESAQLACEAAGAIRTVASLTREEDCLRIYSESLDAPLRASNRSAFTSTFLFALSQSMAFFVVALVRKLDNLVLYKFPDKFFRSSGTDLGL